VTSAKAFGRAIRPSSGWGARKTSRVSWPSWRRSPQLQSGRGAGDLGRYLTVKLTVGEQCVITPSGPRDASDHGSLPWRQLDGTTG
jgi:hypothetical protein